MFRVPVAIAVVAGCSEPTPGGPDVCSRAEQFRIPLGLELQVDVLIVVDRTASMADQAADLAANAVRFANAVEGARPRDLHLAVVTSDLGGDGAGCDARGDRGAFQRGASCGVDGGFVRERLRNGDLERNFTGALADALGCMLDLPLSACPINQPLAAAAHALDGSNPANDGFRRDGAHLLVVVITDGDDCSLVDPTALAAPITGDVEAAIDLRCFALGNTCTPADPATDGAHTGCVPRDDAGLVNVADVAELLRVPPTQTVFAIVAGGRDVVVEGGVLVSGCGPRDVIGAPRLATLTDSEDRHGFGVDACGEDWSAALWPIDDDRIVYDTICFDGAIDREPLLPGIQAECTAELVVGGDGSREPLPFCHVADRDPARACVRLIPGDPIQCPTAAAAARLEPNDEQRPAYAEVTCAVPCE